MAAHLPPGPRGSFILVVALFASVFHPGLAAPGVSMRGWQHRLPSIRQVAPSTPSRALNFSRVARPMIRSLVESESDRHSVERGINYGDSDAPLLSPRNGGRPRALFSWPGLMGGKASAMQYMGGPQMVNPISVHTILYGNWGKDSGISVLESFVRSLSSADVDGAGPTVHKWWNIATQYIQKDGRAVSSQVEWGRVVAVSQGYKKELGDGFGSTKNEIAPIVVDLIAKGRLPHDPNAIYLFLSSSDVIVGDNINGLCGFAGYCGWHGAERVGRDLLQYAVIGDPTDQCNFQCGHNNQMKGSPNGYYSMDSMISTIAHEIIEAATDPVLGKGWIALDGDGKTGWENADLCNAIYTDAASPRLKMDRAKDFAYNVVGLDGTKFLLQTIPDIGKSACALQGDAAGKMRKKEKSRRKRRGGRRKGRGRHHQKKRVAHA